MDRRLNGRIVTERRPFVTDARRAAEHGSGPVRHGALQSKQRIQAHPKFVRSAKMLSK
jgi:hypothetical protein